MISHILLCFFVVLLDMHGEACLEKQRSKLLETTTTSVVDIMGWPSRGQLLWLGTCPLQSFHWTGSSFQFLWHSSSPRLGSWHWIFRYCIPLNNYSLLICQITISKLCWDWRYLFNRNLSLSLSLFNGMVLRLFKSKLYKYLQNCWNRILTRGKRDRIYKKGCWLKRFWIDNHTLIRTWRDTTIRRKSFPITNSLYSWYHNWWTLIVFL